MSDQKAYKIDALTHAIAYMESQRDYCKRIKDKEIRTMKGAGLPILRDEFYEAAIQTFQRRIDVLTEMLKAVEADVPRETSGSTRVS